MTFPRNPTGRQRWLAYCILAVFVVLVARPAAGHAQGIETTLVAGLVLDVPVAFAGPLSCRTGPANGPAVAARLGLAIVSRVQVHVGVGAQDVFSGPACVYDPIAPPANGQFTQERPGDDAEGFIMFPVVAQMEVAPVRLGILEARLLGGVEWLPAKRMWNPIVGAALVALRGTTRIRLEMDRVWYEIPWLTTVTTYQNSVRVNSVSTASTVHGRSNRVRIGVTFYPF